jgi:hypothetical protein
MITRHTRANQPGGELTVHLNRSDQQAKTSDARRLSRRAAIVSGVVAATTVTTQVATAQDTTPVAPPSDFAMDASFLFVQLFAQGSWEPKPDEAGIWILTLSGTSGQTLYFSDRPERIVGTVPSQQFLDALGFTPANPPNAALVVTTPEGARDVLVIELFNPVYSESYGDDADIIVQYEAPVLDAYAGEALTPWLAEQEDELLPAEFTDASLFIDDCPDGHVYCYQSDGTPIDNPIGSVGFCWDGGRLCCAPCASFDQALWTQRCNQDLPAVCHSTCGAQPVGDTWGCP